MGRAQSSILTRILAGFLLVLAGFGAVAAYSAKQHHRSVQALRLINQGYLRVILTIADFRTTNTAFATILDRLLQEEDRQSSLDWLRAARPLRASALRRALEQIESVGRGGLPDGEVPFVRRARRELHAIQRDVEADNRRLADLDTALLAHDQTRAEEIVRTLRRVEPRIATRMLRLSARLSGRITDLSDRAAADEQATLLAILFLAAAALAVGVLVTALSHRMLSPLRRLQEGAEAVARGDLSQRMRLSRTDEIGALATEFDRMLDALQARDAQLKRQAEELVRQERLAAIGKMAAHITHEVRNPLSSIGLNVELLEEEVLGLGAEGATKEARDLLRSIAREVDRLTGLTKDYLRLARVPRPALEPIDPAALVRSVLAFLAEELRVARIVVHLETTGGDEVVSLDESQIRQVLVNLVRNACEGMEGGGTLSISVASVEGGVEIAVADTGPGVPAEERERIFEPFHTTKATGTGLGLPLALQLVRGHGGDIRLESPAGGGARFVVSLPRTAATSVEPPIEDRAEGRA